MGTVQGEVALALKVVPLDDSVMITRRHARCEAWTAKSRRKRVTISGRDHR